MENSLDLSRWKEQPRGVGYRRWVIVSAGMRQLLRSWIFRVIFIFAWLASLAMAVAGFVFSQSVSSGGWLETYAADFSPRVQAMVSALGALVLLYPEICVSALFTQVFWLQSFVGLGLSLIALTIIIPRLITRDRASHALTIYLSRPLTSADYLLGKLGIITGVLLLTWTGPLLLGWLLSMLFAPNREFFIYSLSPLLRALLFNGIALVALSAIALGVSAIGRSSRNAVLLWIGLWLIAGALASAPHTPVWIQRASFSQDLAQVRQTIFDLDHALGDLATKIPLFDRSFSDKLSSASKAAEAKDATGGLISLAVISALCSAIFLRKLRSE
jgi:ABC-2 type transport system permease protein